MLHHLKPHPGKQADVVTSTLAPHWLTDAIVRGSSPIGLESQNDVKLDVAVLLLSIGPNGTMAQLSHWSRGSNKPFKLSYWPSRDNGAALPLAKMVKSG